VRGRLGLNGPNGRRDSSAQITTIETSGIDSLKAGL
jgi:hypothetical protein